MGRNTAELHQELEHVKWTDYWGAYVGSIAKSAGGQNLLQNRTGLVRNRAEQSCSNVFEHYGIKKQYGTLASAATSERLL